MKMKKKKIKNLTHKECMKKCNCHYLCGSCFLYDLQFKKDKEGYIKKHADEDMIKVLETEVEV